MSQFLHPKTGELHPTGVPQGFWSSSQWWGRRPTWGLGWELTLSSPPACTQLPAREDGAIALGVACPRPDLESEWEGLGFWTSVFLEGRGAGVWIPGSKGVSCSLDPGSEEEAWVLDPQV